MQLLKVQLCQMLFSTAPLWQVAAPMVVAC